jgi:hypothetical protein
MGTLARAHQAKDFCSVVNFLFESANATDMILTFKICLLLHIVLWLNHSSVFSTIFFHNVFEVEFL